MLGGPCRNIAIRFVMEKLEWRGDLMVKKFEDTFIHFNRIHERDGRTDRQTNRHPTTAHAAPVQSTVWQKIENKNIITNRPNYSKLANTNKIPLYSKALKLQILMELQNVQSMQSQSVVHSVRCRNINT